MRLMKKDKKDRLSEYNENLLKMAEEGARDAAALQNAVITWAAEVIEFRDEETGRHVERVQKYLKLLLDKMAKSEKYAAETAAWNEEAFLKSAILHDVGKIRIHDGILLKPGRLTEEEFTDMRRHSMYGKTLLENLQSKAPNQTFLEYAKTLAYRHHEKWDGSGYPDGLKGEQIPLQARMMALADVYDALISKRPYKKAFTHEEAMRIIKGERGIHFDPDLTDIFEKLSEEIREISAVR